MAGKTRGSETTGDIVRAVVILVGLLAVVAAFFAVNRPDPAMPDSVEYEDVLTVVRDEYPYRVLAPTTVPDGWRATSVEHTQDAGGNRWRLGFLIGDDGFVGLEQTDGETNAYIQDRLRDFEEDGVSSVAGGRWERLTETGDNPDRALVRTENEVVTIVRGTESYEQLEEFVTWLE